jgi:hypothetical protein
LSRLFNVACGIFLRTIFGSNDGGKSYDKRPRTYAAKITERRKIRNTSHYKVMFSPVFPLILSFSTLTLRSLWRKIEEVENISAWAVAGIKPVIISFQTVDNTV